MVISVHDDLKSSEKRVDVAAAEDVEHPSSKRAEKKVYAAFAAMCVVVLTESLDATSIAVVLPVIAQSLNSSTTITFSLATSFLLASTIFQPVFSSLSSIFGRKPVLLMALILFLIGAIIGGAAKNVVVLLGGRIVQGIGAAGSIALTVIVVTDFVPLRQRAQWLGLLNAMWAIGSVSGPIVAGAFVTTNWRWIFWINVPLVVTSFASILAFLHLNIPDGSLHSKLARIDYIGITIFLVSAAAFLVPITIAGTVCPWSSWRIILPLLLGVIGLVIFIIHQKKMASNPVIHFSIFANSSATIGHFGTFVHGILLWMLLYYLPLYYEGILGYSVIKAGMAAFPETFTVAPAAIVTGLAISRTGNYRPVLWCGWILTTTGMGLLCLLRQKTPIYSWILINLVPGLGLGILVPAGGTSIQAATKTSESAQAMAMFYLLRAAGQTVGVAIGGTIFRYKLAEVLQMKDAAPEATVEGLLRLLRSLHDVGAVEEQELKQAILNALAVVWGVGCALAGVAAIASFWTKAYSLDRDLKAGDLKAGEQDAEV